MKAYRGRSICFGAAIVGAAALGVFGEVKRADAPREPVLESAPHSDRQLPFPDGSALAAKEDVTYLELLLEPGDSGKTSRAPGVAKASAAVDSPGKANGSASGSGPCAEGSRPLGGCDCYDERAGKISRRPNPTRACVDEEAKRLGHPVILEAEKGKFELAGVVPDRRHEAKPEPMVSDTPKVPISRFPASVAAKPAGPAGAEPLGGYPPDIIFGKTRCPPGTKNEFCRCVVFDGTYDDPNRISGFLPPTDPPGYCKNPEVGGQFENKDMGAYWKIIFAASARFTMSQENSPAYRPSAPVNPKKVHAAAPKPLRR